MSVRATVISMDTYAEHSTSSILPEAQLLADNGIIAPDNAASNERNEAVIAQRIADAVKRQRQALVQAEPVSNENWDDIRTTDTTSGSSRNTSMLLVTMIILAVGIIVTVAVIVPKNRSMKTREATPPSLAPSIVSLPSEVRHNGPIIGSTTSLQPTAAEQPNFGWLSLQDETGICRSNNSSEVGCAEFDGRIGNPNYALNCYDVQDMIYKGTATGDLAIVPLLQIDIRMVRFWLGNTSLLPPDLKIQIWNGTVMDGPIAGSDGAGIAPLWTKEVTNYTFGVNVVEIVPSYQIQDNYEFCIGLLSETIDGGLKVMAEPSGNGMSSYVAAPACTGINDFGFLSLPDVNQYADLCIEAMVYWQ